MAAKKKNVSKKKAAPKKKVVAKKSSAKKSAPAKSGKKASASRVTKGKKPAKRVVRKSKRPAPKRKAPARSKAPKVAAPPAPEALKMAKVIAAVAADKKAENIMIIDTRARAASVGYDYVVLASAESDRQLTAIHEGVEQLLKPQGTYAASVEASPDWVCVNYDVGVVAHFFTPDKREMMDLEGLWKDAPRVSA